jgi:hypothetical protein
MIGVTRPNATADAIASTTPYAIEDRTATVCHWYHGVMRFALWGSILLACDGGVVRRDGPTIDSPGLATDADPACASANSFGGFPTCAICDAIGAGCDTIDRNGEVSKVCDCTAGCPCGFHCGSVEIAPNVFVDDVCIR